MKRQEYDHAKLEGTDDDIEISLKEYGMAWIETEDEFLFYYGFHSGSDEKDEIDSGISYYTKFDFCSIQKDINFKERYGWVNWIDMKNFLGCDIMESTLPQRIFDIYNYYGPSKVFGESYWEGLSYEEIIPDYDPPTLTNNR